MKVTIYTDASSNQYKSISACGYILLKNGRILKHEITLVDEMKCSHEAECYAVFLSLIECFKFKNITQVNINSDNLMVIHTLRGKLKNTKLAGNKYFIMLQECMETYKQLNIALKVYKVKAHSNNEMNNKVDSSVRIELRKHLKIAA